jgi:hypothetical protein
MARPVQWPPHGARPTAPAPEKPPMFPPQLIEELSKSQPDPIKIARSFGMSEEGATKALDQFLDIRAKLREKIAAEIRGPYLRGRKAVVQRQRVTERLSPEEVAALAEQAGFTRSTRVIPSRIVPPVSAGGTVIRGMERATMKPRAPEEQALIDWVMSRATGPQRSGVREEERGNPLGWLHRLGNRRPS